MIYWLNITNHFYGWFINGRHEMNQHEKHKQYEENLKPLIIGWLASIDNIQSTSYDDDTILFQLNKNTLDVFSAVVDIYSSNSDITQWIEKEKIRQRQKSLQNHIGKLHEVMISALKDEIKMCDDDVVYDLCDDDSKWIAEVKNKHNTTKGDDRCASFDKLKNGLDNKPTGYKAYYITILRATHDRFEKPFTPSDNKSKSNREDSRIFEIDGASFYEKITKDPDFFSKAFDIFNKIVCEHYSCDLDDDNKNLLKKIKSLSLFLLKIDINSDDLQALCYLPGIKEKTAESIIEYRKVHNNFKSIDNLLNVPGIGKATLNKIKPHIKDIPKK